MGIHDDKNAIIICIFVTSWNFLYLRIKFKNRKRWDSNENEIHIYSKEGQQCKDEDEKKDHIYICNFMKLFVLKNKLLKK